MNSTAGLDPQLQWEYRRLWSLWEMLSSYGYNFFLLGAFIQDTCRLLGVQEPQRLTDAAPMLDGVSPLAAAITRQQAPTTSVGSDWLSDHEQEKIRHIIRLLERCCNSVGIVNAKNDFDRLCTSLSFKKKTEINLHISYITERIIDDLEKTNFLFVPSSKEKYYQNKNLFGESIGNSFPKAAEDISRAGSCFALDQNTACVFHLMRVMEHCVQRFGRKLRVALDPAKESWHQIMLHVNTKITSMPGGKNATRAQNKKKQDYAMAAGRLDHVRIVWRNDVMHPKATYDESEAREVLNAVEAFLNSVVGLV